MSESECKHVKLENRMVYSFTTKCPELLGLKKSDMTLQARVSYKVASKSDNLEDWIGTIFPVVLKNYPQTGDDPKLYEWLIFDDSLGSEFLIPYEWIVEESISSGADIGMIVSIEAITAQQSDAILGALGKMGIPFEYKKTKI